MKKQLSKITVLAAASLFAASTLSMSIISLAPTGVVCPVVGDVIEVAWDDVAAAKKYSVNVVASYDTGLAGDMTDDTTIHWDFGTGDRTDGNPISQSDLTIPLSALSFDFGAGLQPAIAAELRVKGLHPGKNQQQQNNLFSGFCVPAAPAV